jgi:hypothetical protein
MLMDITKSLKSTVDNLDDLEYEIDKYERLSDGKEE